MPVIEPDSHAELITDHDPKGRYNFRVARGYGWVARTKGEAARQTGQFREVDDRGYWEVPADESVWAYNSGDEDFVIEVEKQGFFTELFSPQRSKTPVTAAEQRNSIDEFTSMKTCGKGGANTVFIQLTTGGTPQFFPMRFMGLTISPYEAMPADFNNNDISTYVTVENPDGNTTYEVNTTLQSPQLLMSEGLRFKIPDKPGWKITIGMINRNADHDLDMLLHFLYQRIETSADDGFL